MSSADHYSTLGVPSDADAATIKRAYRAMARRHHPDLNPGPDAAATFAAVGTAYAVLSDPVQRTAYDQARQVTALPAQAAPAGGPRPAPTSHDPFSGPAGGPRRNGTDLHAAATVPFADAAVGAACQLTLRYQAPCPSCHGTGADPTGPRRTCVGCVGLGMDVDGQPCPHCVGAGTVGDIACPACHGTRTAPVETHKTVQLPPGLRAGQRIRLPRQGTPGTGGAPPGDLYVTVTIAPHPVFQTSPDHPNDLGLVLPVTYPELVLGADITIPTLDGGTALFTLPPGSRPETPHLVPGLGLPSPDGPGDLRIWVTLAFPQTPPGPVREALLSLRAAEQATWDPRDAVFAAARR